MSKHTTVLRLDVIERLTSGEGAPFASRKDLADKAGIDHGTLYRIIDGTQRPGPEVIASLLEATGLTYEKLFTREPVKPKRDGPPRPRRPIR